MTDHPAETADIGETVDISTEQLRRRAVETLTTARGRTALLTSCVDDDELTAQHSPLMSPLVWDLAHIGNQEEQWLLRTVGGHDAVRPDIDSLYDAFEHPRSARPKLPLLAPRRRARYASDIRGRVLDVIERTPMDGGAAPRRRLRLRDDRPARAAARRDHAHHPPAAPRPRRADRPEARPPVHGGAARRSPRTRRAASRWAPPPSPGRWTTNGPRTSGSCPRSSSTPCR